LERRDYVTVQAIVLVFAAVVMVLNFVVDLSYTWLDPRIRYR
jgi:peptide/nickel transport system permease protein